MKVHKKDIVTEANSKIKVIGGPLVAIIEKILINVGKDKTKLKSIYSKTNKIYFSKKYLKKHDKIVSVETFNKMI